MQTPSPAPLSNEQVKTLAKLKQKKHRQKEQLFLVEGVRLITEAVSEGTRFSQVIYTRGFGDRHPELIARIPDCPHFYCEPSRLEKISDTVHHQGIIAAAHMTARPRWEVDDTFLMTHPLLLLLDAIADPGNVGTILRTADWFGIKAVVLGKDCVEVYNPKVVRASMGSVFRLALFEDLDLVSTTADLRKGGCRILVSGSKGRSLQEVPSRTPSALIIGSEAAGVSPALSGFAEERVAIPKLGSGESLNAAVACGVLLAHFTRFPA